SKTVINNNVRNIEGARREEGRAAAGNAAAGQQQQARRTPENNVYVDRDGQVYRRTGDGWEQHKGKEWTKVTTPPGAGTPPTAQPGRTERPTGTETARTREREERTATPTPARREDAGIRTGEQRANGGEEERRANSNRTERQPNETGR